MEQSIRTDKPKTTKNSIYFIGGEKGGVGKSFFARCLVDFFITKGWKNNFTLIEGDSTINDVGSIFEDNHEQVKFSDDRYLSHEPNVIIDRIEYKNSVVNLPSNVMGEFDSWFERTGIISLKEKYIENMVYFFVSDGCWRSVELFIKQVKKYDEHKLPHCLVLNQGRLTSGGDFYYLEKICPELIEVLKAEQIPIIYLPVIPNSLQFICDRTNLPYGTLGSISREEITKLLEATYPNNLGEVMATKLTSIGNSGAISTFVKQYTRILEQIFSKNLKNPEGLANIAKRQVDSLKNGELPKEGDYV